MQKKELRIGKYFDLDRVCVIFIVGFLARAGEVARPRNIPGLAKQKLIKKFNKSPFLNNGPT